MNARVLLIEDDARLAGMVADYLGEAGFRATIAPTDSMASLDAAGRMDILRLPLAIAYRKADRGRPDGGQASSATITVPHSASSTLPIA